MTVEYDRPRNPDKRLDYADQPGHHATAHEMAAEADAEAPSPAAQPPVNVHVVGTVVADTTAAVLYGVYGTYVIPQSTAGQPPSVAQLLPQDPLRQYAFVCAIDGPIVVATTQAEAQAASNVTAANPSGGYFPTGWSPPIHHNEPLWAANPSTTASTRVAVIVERGKQPS